MFRFDCNQLNMRTIICVYKCETDGVTVLGKSIVVLTARESGEAETNSVQDFLTVDICVYVLRIYLLLLVTKLVSLLFPSSSLLVV
jgi:hypothetical protein